MAYATVANANLLRGLMSFLYTNQPQSTDDGVEGRVYERNWKGLSRFLLSSYNNSPNFLIEVAQSAAKFAKRLKIGNKRFRTTLDIVEFGTPAVVLTSNLFSKLRQFHKITTEKPNIYNEKERKIRRLLGFSDTENENDDRVFVAANFEVGKDVCMWISDKPKTKEFIIEGFYKDDLQSTQDLWEVERGCVFIVIDFDGRKFVWELSYFRYDDKLSINSSMLYYVTGSSEEEEEDSYDTPALSSPGPDETIHSVRERLKRAVFKDFLRHFDVANNVIYVSRGLSSRKRVKFSERVNQYDIVSFSNEVRKVLKRGRKRGYAFVGVPGTGKSTIIRKLEDSLRDYPMVYLNADNFSHPYEIKETFKTVSYMQPCIVVLEDLDSFRFDEKNERLGVFLDCIDDVNRTMNAVFIASINDTKLVHYTLINRPGRLDQVILVNPPQSAEEAYEVMESRFDKVITSDPSIDTSFPQIGDIDKNVFKAVLQNQMTQADICELIEKAVLLEDKVTNHSLGGAIDSLLMSKKAINVCNFGGRNPYEDTQGTDQKMSDKVVHVVDGITVVGNGKRTNKIVFASEDATYRSDTSYDEKSGSTENTQYSSRGNGEMKKRGLKPASRKRTAT